LEGGGAQSSLDESFNTEVLATAGHDVAVDVEAYQFFIGKLVKLNAGSERVAGIGISNRGQAVGAQSVEFARKIVGIPPVQVGTGLETTKLQVDFFNVEVGRPCADIARRVTVQGDEAGQLAEFCVGLRREGYATAGPCVPVVTIAF